MKRSGLFLTALVALGLFAWLICQYSGWSRINCWTHEINITTGHKRYTRYWFWIATERRVESTWVSDSLGLPASTSDDLNWRMVLTHSPNTRHSPHYYFRSALTHINYAEHFFEPYGATPEAKRKLANAITWLWRHFNEDDEAGSYLTDVLTKNSRKESELTEADVPSLYDWLNDSRARAANEGNPEGYVAAIDQAISALNAPPSP